MDDGFRRAVRINPGARSSASSRTEIRDLVLSVIVLSVAMTMIYGRRLLLVDDRILSFLLWIPICMALVTVSFVMHEFGHRHMARRYGAWAEYRMFPMGLVLTLVISYFGILFAAPGAVMISGRIDDRQYGKVSAAGPAVNLVLAAAFMAVFHMTGGVVQLVAYLFASLNTYLALFNLLPIPPLDGSKIMRWSVPALFLMLVCAGCLLVLLSL